MNISRKTVGKTRLDHVSKQDIRQQCGIQPIGELILKRRGEWDNRVSRRAEDRIVRVVRNIYQEEDEARVDPRSAGLSPFSSRNWLSA
jgi:hypothetical protein